MRLLQVYEVHFSVSVEILLTLPSLSIHRLIIDSIPCKYASPSLQSLVTGLRIESLSLLWIKGDLTLTT